MSGDKQEKRTGEKGPVVALFSRRQSKLEQQWQEATVPAGTGRDESRPLTTHGLLHRMGSDDASQSHYYAGDINGKGQLCFSQGQAARLREFFLQGAESKVFLSHAIAQDHDQIRLTIYGQHEGKPLTVRFAKIKDEPTFRYEAEINDRFVAQELYFMHALLAVQAQIKNTMSMAAPAADLPHINP